MRSFNNNLITTGRIIDIKKAYKQRNGDNDVRQVFQTIIEDTQIAIENIQEVLSDKDVLQQVWLRIRNEETSFADDILGTKEQGNNGSHYRPYLALDGKNIIEIRIADHYETKKTCLDKSNNKVQYLFQVVLITEPPKPESDASIKTNQSVGNVKVLTNDIVSQDTELDAIVTLFQKISNFLQAPSETYNETVNNNQLNCNKHMNKNTIRLSESQLHKLIKEAINELDWKTYSNAAKKQAERDGEYGLSHEKPNRAYRFNSAARDAFNRDYGYKDEELPWVSIHASEPTDWGTKQLPKLKLNMSNWNEFLGKDYNENEKPYSSKRSWSNSLRQTKNRPKNMFQDDKKELNAKFDSAEKEMDNYYNDNYEYEKGGCGWHLKDGMDESIRKAIGKVINEAKAKQQFILKTDDDRYVIQSPIGNFLTLSTEYADPYHKKAAEKIVELFARNGIKVTPIEYLGKYNKETGNFDLDESIRRAIRKILF